jgi:hypothetical protein
MQIKLLLETSSGAVNEGPSSFSLAASGRRRRIRKRLGSKAASGIRDRGRFGRRGPGIVVVEGGCCRQE